jgi:sporulation related protein
MNGTPSARPETGGGMSMADNPRYGSRRGDGSEPRGGPRAGNDPLEELARLIGRDDPFADLRRDSPQSPPRPEPSARPEPSSRPEASVRPEPPMAAPPREEAPNWLARERGGPRRDVADEPDAPRNDQSDWRAGRYRDQGAREEPAAEQFAEPARYAEDPGDGRYGYDRPSGYQEGAYDAPYDGALPVARDYDTDGDYADEQVPDGDEAYDPPHEHQNGSRKTVLAVVGIIALLVGGAFAYRALTTPRDPSQTPVIVADRSPSKIVPAGQGADGQPNKLIYDRVADKPQDSGDLVSREERPVDVRGATPRVVFPGTTAGGGATAPPSQQMLGTSSPTPAPATGGANEPKKVKTLTIRPDQAGTTDTADASPSWPAAAPTVRSVASTPAPAPVSARASRQAAVTPQETESMAAPTRAATSRAPEAGGYLVQLFSGKSETEAQDQFRALQGKYQNLLGGRQPIIRRADLGDKGVFFRAQVGPFATNELANQFCENLKTAGGKCIVQRN